MKRLCPPNSALGSGSHLLDDDGVLGRISDVNWLNLGALLPKEPPTIFNRLWYSIVRFWCRNEWGHTCKLGKPGKALLHAWEVVSSDEDLPVRAPSSLPMKKTSTFISIVLHGDISTKLRGKKILSSIWGNWCPSERESVTWSTALTMTSTRRKLQGVLLSKFLYLLSFHREPANEWNSLDYLISSEYHPQRHPITFNTFLLSSFSTVMACSSLEICIRHDHDTLQVCCGASHSFRIPSCI